MWTGKEQGMQEERALQELRKREQELLREIDRQNNINLLLKILTGSDE